jgi:NTP pyrophosphatase (non-canonical NTP hydrolase)
MEKQNAVPRQTVSIDEQMDANALDRVAARMYQIADEHGFHEGETLGEVELGRLAMFIANLHGECSELWEAARKGKLLDDCDKGIGLSNAAEELADIIIRAMDTARSLGISIGDAITTKAAYNKTRPYKHGKAC